MNSKKLNIILSILVLLLLLLAYVCIYMFITYDNNQSNANNDTNNSVESNQNNTNQTEDNNQEETESRNGDLKEELLKKGYQEDKIIPLEKYQIYEGELQEINEVKDGEKTFYYIKSENMLTNNKHSIQNEERDVFASLSIYKYNDFYIACEMYDGGSVKTMIFDSNFNKKITATMGDMLHLFTYEDYIFYSENKCEGEKSDGTIGNVNVVHRFNTKTGTDEPYFNMDHYAGWAC